ncbi:hypothetical protein GCM10009547_00950 [Sporichthya brevicatena]|uniref:Phosphoserine phosphatase n=1 Tax=Sporichthya brevicatena TaxID=171442 RepID=A0ABN1G3R6_9ACTN
MTEDSARGLHVFDLDGTLLRSAATLEIARHLGRDEVGRDIEERWLAGKITATAFWETLLEICNAASEADLEAAFLSGPWMAGIAETFADIRSRGERVIVISQSPLFFVRGLERWGAHETYGSAVEIGRPVTDTATLLPEAKVEIAQEALARWNLTPRECVAYGDSTSDVNLFEWLPNTVAVNASPVLEGLAAARYVGTDIREAYAVGRQLLSNAGAGGRGGQEGAQVPSGNRST